MPVKRMEKKSKPAATANRTKSKTTHRPETTEFHSCVPRPNYEPVKHSLPQWESRGLEGKIPMFHGHGPSGPLIFDKGHLGTNPYQIDDTEFVLDDPYCHDVSYAYNPLHDPHLKHWMGSGNNLQFLYRQGLITNDLKVICSLKDYNEYRRFLCRKHNELVMRAIRERERRKLEERKVSKAYTNHRNYLAKVIRRLEYVMSEKKPRKISNKTKKTPKLECNSNDRRPVKINEVKSYAVFGRDKYGLINQKEYKGTFIKGSQHEFHLYGDTDRFFKRPKSVKERKLS